MRRKHGLLAQVEVELVDQPDGVLVATSAFCAARALDAGITTVRDVGGARSTDGVLVVKAATTSRGKRALTTLLRGGKIKGRTKDWLRLTRG